MSSYIAFALLLFFLLMGLPIYLALGFLALLLFWHDGVPMVALPQLIVDNLNSETLLAVPLFVMAATFMQKGGVAGALIDCAQAWVGRQRGGLALVCVVACSIFAAICGSSVATAIAIGSVLVPAMVARNYDDRFALGTVGASGTLGILIPPSVVMVLYGILTNLDIGKLFMAGVVPGILSVLLYMAAIEFTTRIRPQFGPPGSRTPMRERILLLRKTAPVVGLFLLVMGGIYLGVFTPTESAGIGATGAFLIALWRRALSFAVLAEVLLETARTTVAMFMILIGAILFSNFLNVGGMPQALADWVQRLDVPPVAVVFAIVLIYLVLGCVLESISMMLLTVPVFFPIVQHLGYDLIWFGVLVVVVIEVGLITPPIGLNVFMLHTMQPEVPMGAIFRGVAPFLLADALRVSLFVFFPALILFLPNLMGG